MKKLEEWFKRGGVYPIYYRLIERTDKTALYKLFIKEEWMDDYEHVGWEVSRILLYEAGERFGKMYPETEKIPTDDMFGETLESDKAFFPKDEKRAHDYFLKFDKKLHQPKEVV